MSPANDDTVPLVDVVIEDPHWEAFGLEDLADLAVRATLSALGMPAAGYTLCIMGCDDARIADLNSTFRGKGKATNVLSWPTEERAAEMPGRSPANPKPGGVTDPVELGDIALAYETCQAEAADQQKSASDHVTHLIVHGVLHLLGYDHIHAEDARLMESLEVRILAPLGVSDPY
jgi:probable rRNA maturation factor